MTVCIAAICRWGKGYIIVGTADRLITYADIEYEHPYPKIWPIASHTVLMISGSLDHHIEITNRVRSILANMPSVTVAAIASLYAQQFAAYRRELAVRKYLEPRGLSLSTFLSDKTGLSYSLASEIGAALEHESLNSEAIIAGLDGPIAHIYEITDPGVATCKDGASWASIGSGWHHADSHFINENYKHDDAFEDVILLTYLAKKKAEVTPGVGSYTDWFWIAGEGIRLLKSDDDMVKNIREAHKQIEKNEANIRRRSRDRIRGFVKAELDKQALQTVSQQQPVALEMVAGGASSANAELSTKVDAE